MKKFKISYWIDDRFHVEFVKAPCLADAILKVVNLAGKHLTEDFEAVEVPWQG